MSYAISRTGNSKVYHRKSCKYVKQIKYYNKSTRKHDFADFEIMGYRPCKYCFDISYKYAREIKGIDNFIGDSNIKHKLIGKNIIILTKIGYWKINYSSDCSAFVLYHGNYFPDDENPERYITSEYHLQEDAGHSQTLMKFIKYIKGHDDFRMKQLSNIDKFPRKTNKQKKQYRKLKKKQNYLIMANTLRLISAEQIAMTDNRACM